MFRELYVSSVESVILHARWFLSLFYCKLIHKVLCYSFSMSWFEKHNNYKIFTFAFDFFHLNMLLANQIWGSSLLPMNMLMSSRQRFLVSVLSRCRGKIPSICDCCSRLTKNWKKNKEDKANNRMWCKLLIKFKHLVYFRTQIYVFENETKFRYKSRK